jgi:hypothetical protein
VALEQVGGAGAGGWRWSRWALEQVALEQVAVDQVGGGLTSVCRSATARLLLVRSPSGNCQLPFHSGPFRSIPISQHSKCSPSAFGYP